VEWPQLVENRYIVLCTVTFHHQIAKRKQSNQNTKKHQTKNRNTKHTNPKPTKIDTLVAKFRKTHDATPQHDTFKTPKQASPNPSNFGDTWKYLCSKQPVFSPSLNDLTEAMKALDGKKTSGEFILKR